MSLASSITKHFIQDGRRNTIVHIHGISDGSGNFSKYKVVDMDELNMPTKSIKVMKVSGRGTAGFQPKLYFDDVASTEDRLFWVGNAGTQFYSDWTETGGESNNDLPNPTGSILLSTVGYDAANDAFELVIWFKKVRKGGQHTVSHDVHGFGYNVGTEDKSSHSKETPVNVADMKTDIIRNN